MKDHATFFRAASALAAEKDSVHFILAGDGVVASNAQVAKLMDSRIRDKVHLLGRRDDVPRLLAAMDVATSASAYGEGFSNAVAEAMACGVPCVVTDVGDAGWIVGDTGMVVPPGSPDLLAKAWSRLLGMDRDQRKRLGERARARVAENFEISAVVRRFEDFYRGLERTEA
jgi:glycosyltransferase involved in cell wall biosynthesis